MKYKFIKENIKIDHLDENFIASSYSSNTTQLVARFYEPDPFPNYNEADNIFDLTEEVLQNKFLKILKKKIGFGKSFIEVGSGTSQLSIALAHATNNFVVAFDPTRNALMLGKNFAKSNNIKNCLFFNSDIFDDPIRPESFDFVWCSGVLHHTKNPYGGFKIISNWAKKNGIIIVGLYNYYGRFYTVLRQIIYKVLGKKNFAKKIINILDPHLRKDISEFKKKSWFKDQYEHPIESLHSIDEILMWFRENQIEFLSSIPSSDFRDINFEKILDKTNEGTVMTRFFSQIGMLFNTYGKEGGLFLVIGRKK